MSNQMLRCDTARKLRMEVLGARNLLSVTTFDLEDQLGESTDRLDFCGTVGDSLILSARRQIETRETLWSVAKDGTVTTLASPEPDCTNGVETTTTDAVFFEADDDLWKTDGTPEGTKKVFDVEYFLLDGGFASVGTGLMGTGHRIDGASSNHYLWTYREGLEPAFIKEFDDSSRDFRLVKDFGEYAFFTRGGFEADLWVTDFTEEGTKLIQEDFADIAVQVAGGRYTEVAAFEFEGKHFFSNQSNENSPYGLEYDPVSGETRIDPDLLQVVADESNMYFVDRGNNLWQKTQGDDSPQYVGLVDDGNNALFLTEGQLFYFGPDSSDEGGESALWTKRAGENEPTRLAAIEADSRIRAVANAGRLAVIAEADDDSNSRTLWVSDGTPAGTRALRSFADAFRLQDFGDDWVFLGLEPSSGEEYWISDGTTEGTRLLVDFDPGNRGSFPVSFLDVNDEVQFVTGTKLWASNGVSDRPTLVHDFYPDRNPLAHRAIDEIRIALESGVSYAYNRDSIWKEDGGEYVRLVESEFAMQDYPLVLRDGSIVYTRFLFDRDECCTSGVYELRGIGPDAEDRLIHSIRSNDERYTLLGSVEGRLMFLVSTRDATTRDYAYSLFAWDETSGGSTRILNSFARDTSHYNFTAVVEDDKVWFSIGQQHWVTDGTQRGTVRVELSPESNSNLHPSPTSNGVLLFQNNDGIHELSLLADATSESRVPLAKLEPVDLFGPFSQTLTGEFLYFFTQHSEGRVSTLWRSDGTLENTGKIADDLPFSSPDNLVTYHGDLYFSAFSAEHGNELWKFDTVTNSASMLEDLIPGPISSHPELLHATPLGIHFQHATENSGVELGIFKSEDSPWHNQVDPLDVNRSGSVTPIDALQVINELNAREITEPDTGRILASPRPAYSVDVNNNTYVSPVDALLVINALNSASSSAAVSRASSSLTQLVDFVFAIDSLENEEEDSKPLIARSIFLNETA